jgi:hypothetical protein
MHLVIIPRLLTAVWRRHLNKICDLVFTLPIGNDLWTDSQFEPLIIGLSLPLSRHAPWKLRGTPLLDGLEGGVAWSAGVCSWMGEEYFAGISLTDEGLGVHVTKHGAGNVTLPLMMGNFP